MYSIDVTKKLATVPAFRDENAPSGGWIADLEKYGKTLERL